MGAGSRRGRRVVGVLCALAAGLLVPGTTGATTGAGAAVGTSAGTVWAGPVRPSGFLMGVASHLGDRKPRTSDGKLDGEIALTELGATTLRDEAGWDLMDQPGWTDALKIVPQNGGKIMLLLDYGNPKYVQDGAFPHTPDQRKAFLEYARAVVAKVGPGNLAGLEVWNEWDQYMGWDNGLHWGDPCPVDPSDAAGCPAVYAQLVESLLYPERENLGVPSLRAAAPGVPIVVNAISARDAPWTSAVMSRLRDRNVQVDGAVLHPYVNGGNGCPGASSAPAGAQVAASCVRLVADEVGAAYGQRLPIYVTEVGWSSYDGPGGVSEDVQARNLVEVYVRARATGDVAGIWWYDLVEDRFGNDDQRHYGLIRRDPSDPIRPGETKPSGHAYAALAHFWAGCTSVDGAYQGNRTFTLSCPDGQRQIVLDATQAELEAALAGGGVLVDLLGQRPDVGAGGDVTALVGHPVGVGVPGSAQDAAADGPPPEVDSGAAVVSADSTGTGDPLSGQPGRPGARSSSATGHGGVWLAAGIAAGVALAGGLAGLLVRRRART